MVERKKKKSVHVLVTSARSFFFFFQLFPLDIKTHLHDERSNKKKDQTFFLLRHQTVRASCFGAQTQESLSSPHGDGFTHPMQQRPCSRGRPRDEDSARPVSTPNICVAERIFASVFYYFTSHLKSTSCRVEVRPSVRTNGEREKKTANRR